jgi:hypothetical protein
MANGYTDPYGKGWSFGEETPEIQAMFGGNQTAWEEERARQWFEDMKGTASQIQNPFALDTPIAPTSDYFQPGYNITQVQQPSGDPGSPGSYNYILGQGGGQLPDPRVTITQGGDPYGEQYGTFDPSVQRQPYAQDTPISPHSGYSIYQSNLNQTAQPPINWLTGFDKPDAPVLTPSGGGPTGPVDPSSDPSLWSSPMPGYIQFHPGGAVYPMVDERGNPVIDPAYVQARQHLIEPVSGMEWSRRFGYIDPAAGDRPYIPDTGALTAYGMGGGQTPADLARRQAEWYAARQAALPNLAGPQGYYTPAEIDMANRMYTERAMNEMALRQQQMAGYLGIGGGGGGGGTFGGGFQGPAYSPYDPYNFPQQGSGIPPVTPVASYPVPPVIEGEPSFLPDPDPLDATLELNNVGLARLPVDARLELDKWLKNMGYATASVGQFGPGAYTRPTGWEDEIAFTADDYGRISDPIVRNWIKWLLGEMGYSTGSQYPGAVAP